MRKRIIPGAESSPYEFRKIDGVWQRRLIGPGNPWMDPVFISNITKIKNGRQELEIINTTVEWR